VSEPYIESQVVECDAYSTTEISCSDFTCPDNTLAAFCLGDGFPQYGADKTYIIINRRGTSLCEYDVDSSNAGEYVSSFSTWQNCLNYNDVDGSTRCQGTASGDLNATDDMLALSRVQPDYGGTDLCLWQCSSRNCSFTPSSTGIHDLYYKCGDGKVADGIEECDDGNNRNNDGCSPTCMLEDLTGKNYCGDGYIQADEGEECDDANDDDFDGCSSACRASGGGTGGTGQPECGDGICEPGEGSWCPEDCDPSGTSVCGDGQCDPGEEDTCPSDCG
jgi:cysteine-rich repeat protein